MAKIEIGDRRPDFELPGTGGDTYRLGDLPRPLGRARLLPGRLHPGLHAPVLLLPRRGRPPRRPRRRGARDLAAVGRLARALHRASTGSRCRCSPTPTTRRRAPTASSRPAAWCGARSSSSTPRASSATATSPCSASRYKDVEHLAAALSLGPRRGRAPVSAAAHEPFDGRGGRPACCAGESEGEGPPIVLAPRPHGDPALRRPRLAGPAARGLPGDLLRRARPRRVGSGARRAAATPTRSWPPTSARCSTPRWAAGAGGPRGPLDGRAHDRRAGARAARADRRARGRSGRSRSATRRRRRRSRYWDRARRRARAGRRRRLHRAPTTTASTRSGARRCCGSPASGSAATAIRRRSPRALREVPRSQPFERPRRARVPRAAGAGRRQPRRGRPGPSLRGRRGLGRAAAAARR